MHVHHAEQVYNGSSASQRVTWAHRRPVEGTLRFTGKPVFKVCPCVAFTPSCLTHTHTVLSRIPLLHKLGALSLHTASWIQYSKSSSKAGGRPSQDWEG